MRERNTFTNIVNKIAPSYGVWVVGKLIVYQFIGIGGTGLPEG